MQLRRGELPTFIVLTVVLTAIANTFVVLEGKLGAAVFFAMWCPGIAALTTRFAFHRNLRGMGWGWGSTRCQLLAYAAPALVCLVAYGGVWALGLGGVSTEAFTGVIAKELGVEGEASFWMMLLAVTTLGFLANNLSAAGEEIGWAGYFTPALLPRLGLVRTSLIVGAFWAVWHFPAILFAGYNDGVHPAIALPCFSVMAVGFSFLRTWLRARSGSLWTGVFLHASHNLFVQAVFDQLTVDLGGTSRFCGEFGVGLALVYGIVAVWMARRAPFRVAP